MGLERDDFRNAESVVRKQALDNEADPSNDGRSVRKQGLIFNAEKERRDNQDRRRRIVAETVQFRCQELHSNFRMCS